MTETKRYMADDVKRFVVRLMKQVGVPSEDGTAVADVLLAADLRGIDSHGVARLRRYVDGVRDGLMNASPNIRLERESPCSAAVDADGALGQVAGSYAMNLAIEKAAKSGIGVVTVRDSNHYGIAGYYSMLALERDMMGVSMTNARARVVPTFARTGFFGTNPISVAVPAKEERPWVLDMATSVVPEGKVEVYNRLGKALPEGWVVDEGSVPNRDAADVLEMLRSDRLGGILPLGGFGEELSGHKGYGLGLLVDILCGVLSGADYGLNISIATSRNLGHFFAALRIDLFQDADAFKSEMDEMIRALKGMPKADGHDRIWIHGEKEYEHYDERSTIGIPLHAKVVADMRKLADEYGVDFDL
jgi:LDH2 family malate/lactate/ureidoglycolate dehydrogenase